jgi:hypothetical protein
LVVDIFTDPSLENIIRCCYTTHVAEELRVYIGYQTTTPELDSPCTSLEIFTDWQCIFNGSIAIAISKAANYSPSNLTRIQRANDRRQELQKRQTNDPNDKQQPQMPDPAKLNDR